MTKFHNFWNDLGKFEIKIPNMTNNVNENSQKKMKFRKSENSCTAYSLGRVFETPNWPGLT